MELLTELGNLTDALLAAARRENPDLVQIARLLDQREVILARLPESTATIDQRLAALRRVQAADSEIRARFERRQTLIEEELRAFSRLGPRRAYRAARSHLVDRSV